MKEHEDTYVAVVEKYTLDGVNTFTLMKQAYNRQWKTLVETASTWKVITIRRFCWR